MFILKKIRFEHTLEGCCGTGTLEMGYTCNAIKPICKNASKYVFFDSVHPTEVAYRNLASSALRDLLPILQSG
ncbi:hypothetical protein LIER_20024 [Lithospermum erythrorhizon]|uniref:GDSL esterase/lipase n=1 Tax=Lithospermum erythrorhizon TaxID=34254 RepID=A0AAV3QLG2_LITER